MSSIFENLNNFFNKYKGLPEKVILTETIPEEKRTEALNEYLDEIYSESKMSTSTLKFIEETTKNFIQGQALKQAIIESLPYLENPTKHHLIKDKVEEALTIGASIDDLGMDAYSIANIKERWRLRKETQEMIKVPLLWPTIDRIFNGGVGNGEILTIMGPAHSGKSMFLVNCGVNALLQRKNVLHVTLEMSEEITIKRYDKCLLDLDEDNLKKSEATQKLKGILKNRIGKLIVKRFPADIITPTDVAVLIRRLEALKDFVPDVLIVDYADIMRSPHKYNDRRHELDSIYTSLRNVAIEFNVPVITATQLNREALKKLEAGQILTEETIAESYGIARIVDGALTINSTPADRINHKSAIYVAKNRDGECGKVINMWVDFAKAKVREWDPDDDGKLD